MKATTISPGIYTTDFDGWECKGITEGGFTVADGHEGFIEISD